MPPKREAEAPLPGDGVFDGDYSDEKRRQVARSDAARLRGSYRYNTGGASPRRDLPLFDRLRAERSQEVRRRRAAQRAEWSSSSAPPATPPPRPRKLQLGEGSSSSAVASSAADAPPPPEYDPDSFGVTLGPEDFVPEEAFDSHLAAALLRSQHEAAQLRETARLREELQEAQLREALLLSNLPQVVDLVSDDDEE